MVDHDFIDYLDEVDDHESMFCPCGMTLMGYPDEESGLCATCTAQPHPGRDSDGRPSCECDECEDYWDRIVAASQDPTSAHPSQSEDRA